MTLSAQQFAEFHRLIHGREPFPWQQMLAERVIEGDWPDCVDLPTASGKTACIDIALFALACQAQRPLAERTTGRRIFFVVDRRIVVDAAHSRALHVARELAAATDGVLREVADRLRSLHGGKQPLAVGRLRGGVARDDGWARSPATPTIITGTVDQVGSRLLFRGYGPGELSVPIHAALVANDSLIVLDEAHCAVPFFQTAQAVGRYRGPAWAQEPIRNPFRVVVMSATPPREVTSVFPGPRERIAALDHPMLVKRMTSGKPAELALAVRPAKPPNGSPGLRAAARADDELVLDAAARAIGLAAEGSKRIAVMVNRVFTARKIHAQLQAERALEEDPLDADLVLMTGRMRPLDRDELIDRWAGALEAREDQPPLDRPLILVTTQCLEVGADFSFDALISECASLDALRQRFGRLDRLGTVAKPQGAVLIRRSQVKTEQQIQKLDSDGEADDPIYGNALARTWNWLSAHAETGDRVQQFRFGIAALDGLLPKDAEERRAMLAPLLAPAPDAPVMLPSHVDAWAQTAPRPRPDPDVNVFLHGPAHGVPEVHAVLRADLDPDDPEDWIEIMSLCPPSSLEAFSVPMYIVRDWLSGQPPDLSLVSDVEGSAAGEGQAQHHGGRRLLIWRGRDRSKVARNPGDVQPYDVVVIPATDDVDVFGDVPKREDEPLVLDLGDRAFIQARSRPMLRVNPAVLRPWSQHSVVARLLKWAGTDGEENDGELPAILTALAQATESVPRDDGASIDPPPAWMRHAAGALAVPRARREILRHPAGGYVVTSRRRLTRGVPTLGLEMVEEDAFADADDLTSAAAGPVPLADHLDAAAAVAQDFAGQCLPQHLVATVVRAVQLHDIGKADWRFQVMLHGGNEVQAFRYGRQLAKSEGMPRSRWARQRARDLAGLPDGFRHEMLSVQIAESRGNLLEGVDRDLAVHLIGAHHGYGRPFAPVSLDRDPQDLKVPILGIVASLTREQRLGLSVPHRLDSGIADRFWRLTRRFGWWGLAYLEAIMRLADWEASNRHEDAMAKISASTTEGMA